MANRFLVIEIPDTPLGDGFVGYLLEQPAALGGDCDSFAFHAAAAAYWSADRWGAPSEADNWTFDFGMRPIV